MFLGTVHMDLPKSTLRATIFTRETILQRYFEQLFLKYIEMYEIPKS